MFGFLFEWFIGTLGAIMVMFVLFAIGSIVVIVVSALGAWTWLFVVPALMGLAFALAD